MQRAVSIFDNRSISSHIGPRDGRSASAYKYEFINHERERERERERVRGGRERERARARARVCVCVCVCVCEFILERTVPLPIVFVKTLCYKPETRGFETG
jgi:hypothetical protein